MNKKRKIIIISIFITLFVILFAFYTHSKQHNTTNVKNLGNIVNNKNTTKVIETTGRILDQDFKNEIADNISVYDFMTKLEQGGRIKFTEKYYLAMGKLITSIDGIKNSGDKNWIYYVNGIEAQVGVSNYKLKMGDIVSWKYEEANY